MATVLDLANQITVTTRRYIRTKPAALVDNLYNQDALNYYLKKNLREDWGGGSLIQETFLASSMIGAPYLKGKNFNLTQRQNERPLQFDIKTSQVAVPIFEEDIRVFNTGPLAVINLLKSRVNEAYMTLGEMTSFLTYLNGIQAGYTPNINGLAEALNDGTTQAWDGNTYPTYGGLTRATFSPTISSTPLNAGGGQIEYNVVDQKYMSVFYGAGQYEPNLCVTTPTGFSYFKSKFQTQQRFQDTKLEVGVGFRGLQFNGATVVATRLAPGSYLTNSTAGQQDQVVTTILTEMFNGVSTNYPTGNLGTTGETFWILNARKPFLNYYVSKDQIFGGGFRDFIPAAGTTLLAGMVFLAHQLTVHPRYSTYIYNFAG